MSSEFLEQFHGDFGPLESGRVAAARSDAVESVRSEREAAERAAREQERAETLALANRMGGDPAGELSRHQAAYSAADDQVNDLLQQLRRAEAKRDRARSNVEF